MLDKLGGKATGEYGAAEFSTVVTLTVVAFVDPKPTEAFRLSACFISYFVFM